MEGDHELRTLETRWFFEGEVDASFARWFLGQEPRWEHAETRTDVYLVLPDREDVGVKRRGGRVLEVKRRLEVVGVRPLDEEGRSEAVLERWVKTMGDRPPEAREALRRGKSVEVHKRRFLRLEPLGEGAAGVELTRVEVEGRPAWTFALEALPDEGEMTRDLVDFARDLIQGAPRPLPREACRAYPAWLGDRM